MMVMTVLIGIAPAACLMLTTFLPEAWNEWLLKNKHYALYFIVFIISIILFLFTQNIV